MQQRLGQPPGSAAHLRQSSFIDQHQSRCRAVAWRGNNMGRKKRSVRNRLGLPTPPAGMVRHETEMNSKRGLRERIVGEEQLELVKDIGEQAGLGQPCSICGGPIAILGSWKLGNNAQPINNGRCCDKCDKEVVIPARMKRAKAGWSDLRSVEPDWQEMGETVLNDIRRESKLEQ